MLIIPFLQPRQLPLCPPYFVKPLLSICVYPVHCVMCSWPQNQMMKLYFSQIANVECVTAIPWPFFPSPSFCVAPCTTTPPPVCYLHLHFVILFCLFIGIVDWFPSKSHWCTWWRYLRIRCAEYHHNEFGEFPSFGSLPIWFLIFGSLFPVFTPRIHWWCSIFWQCMAWPLPPIRWATTFPSLPALYREIVECRNVAKLGQRLCRWMDNRLNCIWTERIQSSRCPLNSFCFEYPCVVWIYSDLWPGLELFASWTIWRVAFHCVLFFCGFGPFPVLIL